MPTPRILVLRAPGTNCDRETAYAFERAGGQADLVHINRLHCGYPYAELFRLLKAGGYEGYCLAELPAAGDVTCATEFLRYYRQSFELLGGA